MRLLLTTTVFALAAGNAAASSIEAIASGKAGNTSVATISCPQCPPLQTKKKVTYVVPTIDEGAETVELRKINGEMKMVRTEAWLGGSPVVFVSKPSQEVIKAAAAKTGTPTMATASMSIDITRPEAHGITTLAIDETAKTAAVTPIGASMAGSAAPAPVADVASRQFDPSTLELRLD